MGTITRATDWNTPSPLVIENLILLGPAFSSSCSAERASRQNFLTASLSSAATCSRKLSRKSSANILTLRSALTKLSSL